MSKTYFETAPVQCPLQRNELYMHLYLRRIHDVNQAIILEPKNPKPNGFGVTAASDWTITDGSDSNAKIVARAEGFHMQAGLTKTNYYTSFNIVFEDDRFKGSTLQVMGVSGDFVEGGQWAISSGTGELALAHGLIKHKPIPGTVVGEVRELHIHAFYTPMNNLVVPGATDGKSWTLGA